MCQNLVLIDLPLHSLARGRVDESDFSHWSSSVSIVRHTVTSRGHMHIILIIIILCSEKEKYRSEPSMLMLLFKMCAAVCENIVCGRCDTGYESAVVWPDLGSTTTSLSVRLDVSEFGIDRSASPFFSTRSCGWVRFFRIDRLAFALSRVCCKPN